MSRSRSSRCQRNQCRHQTSKASTSPTWRLRMHSNPQKRFAQSATRTRPSPHESEVALLLISPFNRMFAIFSMQLRFHRVSSRALNLCLWTSMLRNRSCSTLQTTERLPLASAQRRCSRPRDRCLKGECQSRHAVVVSVLAALRKPICLHSNVAQTSGCPSSPFPHPSSCHRHHFLDPALNAMRTNPMVKVAQKIGHVISSFATALDHPASAHPTYISLSNLVL